MRRFSHQSSSLLFTNTSSSVEVSTSSSLSSRFIKIQKVGITTSTATKTPPTHHHHHHLYQQTQYQQPRFQNLPPLLREAVAASPPQYQQQFFVQQQQQQQNRVPFHYQQQQQVSKADQLHDTLQAEQQKFHAQGFRAIHKHHRNFVFGCIVVALLVPDMFDNHLGETMRYQLLMKDQGINLMLNEKGKENEKTKEEGVEKKK